MMDARAYAIAQVNRELAEFEAADAAVAAGLAQRGNRRITGASVVYSIRLDPGEVAALERRAAALDLKPTVLARNLIRAGLRTNDPHALGDALERLEAAAADIRAVVG